MKTVAARVPGSVKRILHRNQEIVMPALVAGIHVFFVLRKGASR
jgi:hypothetical protein